jgi:hypothetical protein
MLAHDDFKWTSYLYKIVELYNDTPNQGIDDKTPEEVFSDLDYMEGLYKGQKKHNQDVNDTYELKPGDTVRAMVGKGIFEKEKAKFSTEIYKVIKQEGYRFVLENENGNIVKRKYRPSELIVVKDVIDRIGSKTKEAEEKHKKINKVRKATSKTYEEADRAIKNKDEPKKKRVIKKVQKLDI